MSIPVDVADLERTLADFGAGYLLTASTDGAVKVVTVEPTMTDGMLLIAGPGRGTLANLAANPAAKPKVTLAFPPREERGFTLLVDGTAETDGAEGQDVRVTPTGAVLHRPAAHSDGPLPPEGCGHDCHPVG